MTDTENAGRTVEVSDASFSTDVLASDKPVLVDFWATGCGPCNMVAPVLEEIAAERGSRLTVAKLDVDANPRRRVTSRSCPIPTMILFKDGQPVKRIVGAKGKAALLRELPTWCPTSPNLNPIRRTVPGTSRTPGRALISIGRAPRTCVDAG